MARLLMLLLVSWVVMTFTHELGHLIGGWTCGATLQAVDMWPWRLPYSLFDPDPLPLVTLWSGPILGVLLPVGLAAYLRHNWMWFVAHFCTLANGLYLATAWYSGDRFLDTQRLFAHGASPLAIGLYCILTIGFGYIGFRRSIARVYLYTGRTTESSETNI
ncbi:MAG: hypothetical protein Q8M16_07355 [Pirellulaceae bacterium]|nr:hypothetical protein [Pirellulaceae bacterium]